MITNRLRYLILPVIFVGIFTSQRVRAETVRNNQRTSDISVRIVASPITLGEVTAPSFGTYNVSSKSQKVTAASGLKVQVKDERHGKDVPWQLKYSLVVADNSKEKALAGRTQLFIGEGRLTADGTSLPRTQYQPKAISLQLNEDKHLVDTVSAKATNYEYGVPKENIQLAIKENTPAGTYDITQVVTLNIVPPAE
ncbi:hypothetical protein [Vagococcus acidifermentans]|uniref:WxL domain-containing protein n=1 Tax=Vagococcus acidifermentans TaxID=564710 RepID=A0A430B2W9_9ENTE|nr:hypothetical protein [Vagococcus acidifermentans]RSU14686.1 hypothetical protein CBF27_01530 [Vagococcus acidifermentans]